MTPLVRSTLRWRDVEHSEAEELDGIVFEGYLEGLYGAGRQGDPRKVRLGPAGEMALGGLGTLPGVLGVLLDDSRHAWLRRTLGLPVEEFADFRVERAGRLPVEWADEAWELLDEP